MRAGSVSFSASVSPTRPVVGRVVSRLVWVGLSACALLVAGCSEEDMVRQPKFKPLQPSTFFSDGQSSRPLEPGTIARGQLRVNPAFDTGMVEGKLVDLIPVKGFDSAVTPEFDESPAALRRAALERGRERFNIYCAPCHSRTGDGLGMIVQRGFSRPPSLHEPRLRDAPAGHFFHVISNGYGAMYSYASRIAPADRWAIVAYIRALQRSQNAQLADVPLDERAKLEREVSAR
jgi:mono/diheme cytochrome c family protein